jgi:hypothetical protein
MSKPDKKHPVREAGDPARVRREGAALAKKLLERRRAVLKQRAQADLAARRAAAKAVVIPRDSRLELLAMLAKVQKDPRYAERITAMFRKRKLEEASNDEIATLLEEIEAARLAEGDSEEPN